MVLGPVAHYVDSLENSNESTKLIWDLMNGSKETVPATIFWLYVDVRDLALAHILAFEKQEAGNQRILVTGPGNWSFQKAANILREIPEIRHLVPEGNPDEEFPKGGVHKSDVSKSVRLLGIEYRSMETSLVDTARNLLAVEKRLKAEGKI